MNQILIAVLSFSITFVVGSLLVPKDNYYVVTERESVHLAQPAATGAEELGEKMTGIEFSDLAEMDEFAHLEPPDNLIDISETQGTYRESEVVARSGEKWLTLRERNGSYSLVTATANVKKKPTISYPGDEHDVELSFFKGRAPIFAVRKIPAVKPGPVTTLYHRPSRKEIERRNLPIDPMKTGFKREFDLNDVWYTLRVSRGRTSDGTIVGILVLESDGVTQVIARNYYEPPYGETIGELLWVGDLDRDGKLDLYFDEFNEKGYFGVGLYLSSSADPGKLVKLVATFAIAGC
jgi:hypothetical protein